MKKIETPLDGAFIIEPQVFGDVRGWFYESYSKQKMHDIGIYVEFVQDNRSFSAQRSALPDFTRGADKASDLPARQNNGCRS